MTATGQLLRRFGRTAGPLAAILLSLWAGTAAAEDASLNAVLFKAVPPGAAISVKPWDNSDDNMTLAADFEKALRDKGYRVVKDGGLVLSFEIRDILGTWDAGDRRNLVELDAHGGRTGGEDARAMLNLYQSARGGVFNKGRPTRDVEPSKYQLDVTLDSKEDGRLWQAHAIAALVRTDSLTLTRRMIPGLVGAIGTTVKQGKIPLR